MNELNDAESRKRRAESKIVHLNSIRRGALTKAQRADIQSRPTQRDRHLADADKIQDEIKGLRKLIEEL